MRSENRNRLAPRIAAGLLPVAVLAGCTSTQGATDDPGAGSPGVERTFDVRHEITVSLPDGKKEARIWLVKPQEDPAQRIADLKVESPYPPSAATDDEGNDLYYIAADGSKGRDFSIVTTFTITRAEVRADVDPGKTRPITAEDRAGKERWLAANEHVVIDAQIEKTAAEATGGEENPIIAARKIYDWVLENIDYWVKDPANKKASKVGSTEHCLTTKTGNCTDFHSLYASLSRAAGIPTRIVYGSLFKAELDGKDADQSYHCWIEVFAPELGWVPLDVAVADIFVGDFEVTDENGKLVRLTTADGYEGKDDARVDFYFGGLDARRVTWSRGRDLVLDPKPAKGKLNALPKAYIEVDGEPLAEKAGWTRKLTFTERK